MKEKFEVEEISVILFDEVDIIATSPSNGSKWDGPPADDF